MLKIAFLMSGPCISGGVSVILQHAKWCHKQGHQVSLLFDSAIAPEELSWHPVAELVRARAITLTTIAQASDQTFDFALATYWRTFFDLWRVNAEAYAYLVQSVESRFVPASQMVMRGLIEATYEFGVPVITIAHWIKEYLEAVHGGGPTVVLNGVDKGMFRENGTCISERAPGRLRVLVEGPVNVPFKNVPRTVELCRAAGAREVWLLTGSPVGSWPGVDRVFACVPQCKTAEIYRSCDVIVKLSLVEGMFGPPLEMFHCGGTCIVYDVTGFDEYIEHGVNGLVVPTGSEDLVANWLTELGQNPKLLRHLQTNALVTAKRWPDWQASGHAFEAALHIAAQRPPCNRDTLRSLSRRLTYLARLADLRVPQPATEELAHLEEQVQALQLAKAALLQSTSWKVTAPLRALRQGYSRLSWGTQSAA